MNTVTNAERAHSPLGFSQATRYLNCAGSVAAVALIPPKSAGPYAEEGTDAHSLGERCLISGEDAKVYIGTYIRSHMVTIEMAEAVQVYLDAVRAALAEAGPGAELHVEAQADVSWLHKDLWGSLDAAVVVPFVSAKVFDFKYGVNPVEADCDQGKGYCLFAWHHYDVPESTFVIVQPRAAHADGPVRAHTYSRADMIREAARFKAGAEATEKPGAPLVPGPWCKKSYCAAAATCKALHRKAVAIAHSDFAAVKIVPPAPHTLTPPQLRMVLDQADVLEGWIKSVHAFAMSEARAGRSPQGYKLVAGKKGNRQWTSEGDAISALESAGFEAFEKSVISVATAEKLVGKADFKKYADLVRQPDGKPTLVPESDKRAALPAGPLIDFEGVDPIDDI